MKETTKFRLITACFILFGILSFSFSKTNSKSKTLVVAVDSVKPDSVINKVDTQIIINESKPLREKVYKYLTEEKGLSRNHAIGLIANGDRESGWKTSILGDNGTSGGIFQWHATRFERMKNSIPNWKNSWKDQIDYALDESVGPEWCETKFSSPKQAADWWMDRWEIPANKERAAINNSRFINSYEF